MRSLVARSLVAFGLLVAVDLARAGERIISKYTSTARAKSLSFKDESNIPEGGFEALFSGFGGYRSILRVTNGAVLTSGSGKRRSICIRPPWPRAEELFLTRPTT